MTSLPPQIPTYISSIPTDATEQVMERFPSGAKKVAYYYQGSEWVGNRQFTEGGTLIRETSFANSLKNGWHYEFNDEGVMLFREWDIDGAPDGIVSQWNDEGEWIGSYEIIDGNGWEFWWQGDKLEEAYPLKDRHWHGVSWHINDDQVRCIKSAAGTVVNGTAFIDTGPIPINWIVVIRATIFIMSA